MKLSDQRWLVCTAPPAAPQEDATLVERYFLKISDLNNATASVPLSPDSRRNGAGDISRFLVTKFSERCSPMRFTPGAFMGDNPTRVVSWVSTELARRADDLQLVLSTYRRLGGPEGPGEL